MWKCSRLIPILLLALGCVAMIVPETVEARGGGGGGGGRGGGGGFGGGFRGGGFGGGGFGGYGGGYNGGYGGYRGGYNGGYDSGFRGGNEGGYNGGYGTGYRGETGNFGNAGNSSAFTRGSAPMSPGFRNNEMRGDRFNRFRRGEFGGFGGWGWWLGDDYWGFNDPWWYGGFPFWYADLGYGDYYNPYYDMNPADYANYNYGTPMPQATNEQNPDNDQYFAAAREAFYGGNYQNALQDIQQAIVDLPGNQDVHEFFALTLSAMGDYNKAAAVTYDVLNAGPGWDWTILQSFYASPDVYTKQLRALEHYVTAHAQDAAPRFLLADQYLMIGHFQAAERQLQGVVSLEPRDKLSANILAALKHAPGVETPSASGQASAPVSSQALAGTWHAHPTPNATVDVSLQPNHTFTWTVSNNGQSQSFSGTYTQQGNDVVLTRSDGQKMEGLVSMTGSNELRFRLKNGNPNDPGLQFSK
jgi:tetratricopeptide (TPR) repeat protein